MNYSGLVRPSREPGWVSLPKFFFVSCIKLINVQLIGTINGKTGLIPENYISFTSGV